MKQRTNTRVWVTMAGLALLLLVSCSKEAPLQEASRQEEAPEISFQLPAEVLAHLTETEIDDIYHSQPPVEVPVPEGAVGWRDAGWHFWVTWGNLPNETFYAVVGECTPFDVPNNICFDINDCPDPSSWNGAFSDAHGDYAFVLDRNPRRLRTMEQVVNNLICFGSPEWPNFGFLPDGGPDRAQFYPSTVPGEIEFTITPDLYQIVAKIYACSGANPHFLCWMPSTGQYENMQGSLTWKFTGDPDEILAQTIFGPPANAFVIAWGWLYY